MSTFIAPVGPSMVARPLAMTAGNGSRQSFDTLLVQRSAQETPPLAPSAAIPAALELARGIERAQRGLDAALEAARCGRTFTPRELLSLQAQAYRYAQTLEIASKVVEHSAQTVKQAVNTQV